MKGWEQLLFIDSCPDLLPGQRPRDIPPLQAVDYLYARHYFAVLENFETSAFKELEPIPQFRATAKLGEFLEARFSQSF